MSLPNPFDLTESSGCTRWASFRPRIFFLLPQAMEKYVRSHLVHFATLDIERVEYGILDELKYGGVFDKEGIVFCRIKKLVRYPLEKDSFRKNTMND
jgi:hypothetical protein